MNTPSVPSKLLAFASIVAFSAVVAATAYRTVDVYHVPVPKETKRFGLCDFHNAVYFPGLAYSRGENPYSPEYAARYPVNREMSPYSPLLLPFSAIFGLMPLRTAEIAWFASIVLLTLVYALLLLRLVEVEARLDRIFFLGTLILLTRAGHSNLILGQLALHMSIATLLALQFAKGKPFYSGVAVTIASIKPTFGIPLVILMFCQRRFRAVFIGVGLGLAGALLSAGWIALSSNDQIVSSLQSSHDAIVVDSDVDPTSAWMRTDLLSVVSRATGQTPDALVELAFMALLLIPACLAVWRTSAQEDQEHGLSLSNAIILAVIPLCIYHLIYDVLLVLPILAVLTKRDARPWSSIPIRVRVLLFVFLLIPVMNYFTTWSIMTKWGIEGSLRSLAISINAIALLAANVLLWYVALSRRRQP